MRFKDLVLTGLAGICLSCTSQETITEITKIKYYPIGISGLASESTLTYNNKKIKIISFKDNSNKYQIVFAPKSSELINFINKNYGISDKILFITPEKTEEIIIN